MYAEDVILDLYMHQSTSSKGGCTKQSAEHKATYKEVNVPTIQVIPWMPPNIIDGR